MTIEINIITEKDIYITENIYKTLSIEKYNSREFLKSDADVIGLSSENHYLSKYDYPLTKEYVNDVMNEYDLILPYASKVREKSVRSQYTAGGGDISELQSLESLIEQSYSGYVDAFNRVVNCRLIAPHEQVITRRHLLVESVKFIDDLINKLSVIQPISDVRFIRDILFRTWLSGRIPSLKVKEENLMVKNPEYFRVMADKRQVIYNYIRDNVNDLIYTRKTRGFEDSLIEDIECEDDFDNKIPVWICWWQGIEELPDVVQMCVDSIKRNIPEDTAVIRFITLENCGKYVTLTTDIVQKFNEGKISYTHLAEALRAELLYRYGGLWIDATYYMSKPVDRGFFEQNFFSVAFDSALFGPDISEGRWSTSLWYVKPKSKLMQFITEEIWVYWEKNEEVVDYFIMDYETAIAYNEFDEIRQMMDACPKSSPAVYELQLMMNQRCTEEAMNYLTSQSAFYKINRRLDYKKQTDDGYMTIYGCISDMLGNKDFCWNQDVIEIDIDEDMMNVFSRIREINPARVLDEDMCITKAGYVSRVMLTDVIFAGMTIDAIRGDDMVSLDNAVYDRVLNINDCDYEAYDLIIRRKC